jgi:5-formyltetrahydrofolate cyclo-ligase
MTKAELRKSYLQKRLALSDADCLNYGRLICEQFFFNFDLSFLNILHLYLPIEKNKEPDTWLILDRVRREFPNVRITVPRVRDNQLENIFFEGLHQLEKNAWGIPEPKQGMPTPTEKIDLVIIPLLAFDQVGHRVGYGRGFYDRFLKECRLDCKKVGLSFFGPIEKIADSGEHDVTLTHCITPYQLHKF